MDLKFLLASFLVLATPPKAAIVADPVELGYPNISVAVGESRHEWVEIRTSQPEHNADVVMRFDATAIKSIAKVSTNTADCATAANVITCHRKMDLDQGNGSVALVFITGQGKAGTGQVTITASVDGKPFGPVHSTVTVVYPPKLVLVGATIKAPGKTKVEVTVGIRNVGKGLADFPPIAPNLGSVTHYVSFPAENYAESMLGQCYPWGPYPEGWGWQHPTEPSYKYACSSGDIEPGATSPVWLRIVINPKRPVVTGYISFRDGATSPDLAALIVIDTRQTQETLPQTGFRVRDVTVAALALIAPGTLLLMFTRRTRRSRRTG